MYYLINTFNESDRYHFGTVISTHRTPEAAQRAKDKISRSLEHGSYLPMEVVESAQRFGKRERVRRDEGQIIPSWELETAQ